MPPKPLRTISEQQFRITAFMERKQTKLVEPEPESVIETRSSRKRRRVETDTATTSNTTSNTTFNTISNTTSNTASNTTPNTTSNTISDPQPPSIPDSLWSDNFNPLNSPPCVHPKKLQQVRDWLGEAFGGGKVGKYRVSRSYVMLCYVM